MLPVAVPVDGSGESAGSKRSGVILQLVIIKERIATWFVAFLNDDDLSRRMVISQEAQVRQSGVTGVPDFLINKRLFVVGAQSTDSLVGIFDRVMFGAESDLEVSATVH